jgi:hypothetical protein
MQHYNFILLLYFLNLLDVHRVGDIRQIEIRTADPSPFEVEIAIAK